MDAWIAFVVYMSIGNALSTDPGGVVVDLPNTVGVVNIPKNKSGVAKSSVYPIPGFMKYNPRKKHLKLKKLRRKMAFDFDDEWMSIERPRGHLIDAQSISLSNTKDNTNYMILTGEVNKLNFSMNTLQDGVFNVSSDIQQYFKHWLLEYAFCHVKYVWKDLSVLFWPRWVKHGYCSSTASCSWPPGMHCVPSESKMIKLLRWNCRKRKRKNRKGKDDNMMTRGSKQKLSGIRERRRKRYRGIKCKWIKIHYPVTQQCFCSC